MSELKHCGPFTFRKREDARDETWDIINTPKAVAHFCIKNYGGEPKPNEAFSGWRLVSAGPFCDAGGWTNVDDAIKGATPYLIRYYKESAERVIREATEQLIALDAFTTKLEQQI